MLEPTIREAAPGDDLISALIAAEHDGERLSRAEAAAMVAILLVAGHDTAVWRDADVFDPRRFTDPDAPRLLTFGGGVHACFGTWLARLTLEEMARAVADLAPTLTTPKADIPWTRVLGENPERLPVAVG